MGIRTCVCARKRWRISWEPFETVRALSDELMREREGKRESEKRRYQSEPKTEREPLLHILTQARSHSDAYPRDVSSIVLCGKKNPLTGYPAAAKTHHLNSVTHLLRSAVTCLQTRRALSVYLRVINHQLCNFLRKAHRGIYALRSNSWRDDTNPPMRHQK